MKKTYKEFYDSFNPDKIKFINTEPFPNLREETEEEKERLEDLLKEVAEKIDNA